MIGRLNDHPDLEHRFDDLEQLRTQRSSVLRRRVGYVDPIRAKNLERNLARLLAIKEPVHPFQLRNQVNLIMLNQSHSTPPCPEAPSGHTRSQFLLLGVERGSASEWKTQCQIRRVY